MIVETKYCKHCGEVIDADCVICPKCGKQVEELKSSKPDNIIINNSAAASASASNTVVVAGKMKRKWVSFFFSDGWAHIASMRGRYSQQSYICLPSGFAV